VGSRISQDVMVKKNIRPVTEHPSSNFNIDRPVLLVRDTDLQNCVCVCVCVSAGVLLRECSSVKIK
jgi:hypothetical protein